MKDTEIKVQKAPEQEEALDRNVRLMSPGRMVMRRFFRSKLSILGLVLIIFLFAFCWLGPLFYTQWGQTEVDDGGKVEYVQTLITYEKDGKTYSYYQLEETHETTNSLAKPSWEHPLGTDETGKDVLARLMYGGRISLTISFLTVFVIAAIGVVFGGIAGYFGGIVDNIIMRVCDVLMCLPGIPIMLVVGTVLDSWGVDSEMRIYYLMGFLALISWPGTARLVRGQILSLREQ